MNGAGISQEHRLVPGSPCVPGITGQTYSQTKVFVGGAEPSEHVADLIFAMECRFVEADEAIARSQVLPDVFVRRNVRQADLRARGKSPSPRGSADKVRAHGFVEA